MSVHTWGLGASGQLGSGETKIRPLPQIVTFINKSKKSKTPRCKQVSCGGLYTSILTINGEVFSSGCGKNGRLGNETTNDQAKFQVVENLGKNNKTISSGIWHGAAIKQDNTLCVWGHPKACMQPDNKMVGSPPVIIPSANVTGVSCGFNYTLFWTLEGQAFSFGSSHYGAGGHNSRDDVLAPQAIEALHSFKIIHMSAGYNHSGAVTQDGKLFMFGKGSDGALGFGKDKTDQLKPMELTVDGASFASVSCSVGEHHGHTLALTDDGHVYSWGDGYKGKLGHGDQTSVFVPNKIDPKYFNGETIVQVEAGGIHSCALSKNGHVYTWGCGSDGRLGHPESIGHRYLFRSDIPKLVEELKLSHISQVACSYYHMAALV